MRPVVAIPPGLSPNEIATSWRQVLKTYSKGLVMQKTYRIAILSNTETKAKDTSVVRYTHITAFSYQEARCIAEQIGALVCSWRVAA